MKGLRLKDLDQEVVDFITQGITEMSIIPSTEGQTVYTIPEDYSKIVTVFISSLKATEGEDYTISGSTLTWINGDITLDVTDEFILQYYPT